jgi:uncharacterized protein (TIGR00297 family)
VSLATLLAYLAAGGVAYAGYRARALSAIGALAACLVGGTIFGFGGLVWALLLVLFFVSSSALSFVKASDSRKRQAAETFEKGGTRDAAQVFANGGVAAIIALASGLSGAGLWSPLFGAYVGALATATADTWATEIGVLSKAQPRLIITGRPVPRGTSGGVTWLGSSASAAGGAIIGVAALLLAVTSNPGAGASRFLLLSGLLGGLAGSIADSLLGATVQASYRCPRCDKPTESRPHDCGTPTIRTRGISWINNDLVNLLATIVGAVVGGLPWWLLAVGN